MGRKPFGFVVASALAAFGLTAAPTAQAAPAQGPPVLIVGQSQATCPGAQFDNIQAAINAAKSGGTVQICPGTYVAGNGLQGTNALTITKDLTLAGAGADQVTIEPRNSPASDGQIAENRTDIRDGKGDILAAIGKVQSPITVNISGITFDANGVYTTAGVVFVEAQGSLDHSRVTGVDINESAGAYSTPGGFRSNPFGYGVADVTRATPATAPTGSAAIRTLTVDHTRIDHYNAIGILIDGSTNDYSQYAQPPVPLVPSGIQNKAVLTNDQIIGRNLCQNYNDPTAGGPTVIDGDCEATGGSTPIPPPLPLTTGPLFGQDGVRVTAGASVQMTGDTVSSNLVNGTGSPVQTVLSPTPNNDPYPLGNYATNNQNLRLGAGVRLVGAGASAIGASNITDNAFGVLNTTLDGMTADTATPVTAQNDWWGLRTGNVSLPTPGPAVWPDIANPSSTTYNPPVPENPVNGSPVADSECPSGVSDSAAVTFCPYRDGDQADTLQGEYPIPNAPGPVSGSASCSSSASQYDPNIPSYDSFFNSTLGSGSTGDGLSGASPSAQKTGPLMAYMQAVVDAINNNPNTTGQRVAAKIVQEGTSVLGTPFDYVVIGTPDNIANLNSGRDDQAFWTGVMDGSVSQSQALAQVNSRPAFAWVTGAPHGNEPAGGEASVKELYELAARTDCDNAQRLQNLDVFIQPVTAPDDRDHNNRTTAWDFDPNRDRGTIYMPENRALIGAITQYPGLFFVDAHQQSSGYFFPPDQDAALNEISHQALDAIQNVIGPAIQNAFNDQTGQYRNYNTYDLFVPEYGDTVPSLLMGGAGMTYEKGNNENYGKQVYDHYLAIDTTVNVVAQQKDSLAADWVKQWPQAVAQGQSCTVQDNTQVSPPVVDQYEIGQSSIDQEPNVNVCGYYYLPGQHSGDVAQTIKDLQYVGVKVYRLDQAVTVPGVHTFGAFNINAVEGQGSPDLTTTMTLPAGTLYIPMAQGTKHWIQAVLDENPYLPFNYFYDQVTWSYSLLRGFAGDGFLTQQMPSGTPMTQIGDPGQGTAPADAQAVYAFNTDSMAGLAMVNQLINQGASVSRAAAAFDASGQHFDSGAALVDGSSINLDTLTADATKWETPVFGLDSYPVSHFALSMPKIAIYTGGTTVPTNPAIHGSGDGYCTTSTYCEAMFDLTQKEGIPTSQISELTSTDLANGVLQSGGYTVLIDPGSTISATTPTGTAGTPATGLQAFINAGGMFLGTSNGGATSARNAGVTMLNTNTISGISTPGSTFDASWDTTDPAGWGMDSGGWIYRESSNDPNFDPATLAGNGSTIPAATAVATYAPAGDCGGPAGFGNCYGYEIKGNANLPGRPAVVDQPFGAGHAIMLGFDPWYRAWTTEEERLVLNAILFPSGSAIPATTVTAEIAKAAANAHSSAHPVAAGSLPNVASRPVRPSGGQTKAHNPQ
ncbi:MAG TPA: hypothetical protein VEV61_09335 [Streptosporangiaceae bacterium]|nr:hypothetical protein [Streptosporangiaceae bacterium]